MTGTFRYSALAFVLLGAVARAQQGAAPPPPPVVTIFEEVVKPGKIAAHEKTEIRWAKTWADHKWPGQSLAMKTMAGTQLAWFLSAYESMGALENERKATDQMAALTAATDLLSAQDGELLTGVRSIILSYRPDLSYLPSNSVPVPKLRYFDVEITQTRPGHTAEFVQSRRLLKTAHEKASMPDGVVMYAVVAGLPTGTFIRFRGLQSLADVDRYEQAHNAKAYQDVLSAQSSVDALVSSSVGTTQHVIFEFDPKMSYMAKDFTSQDPDFWTPKPKPAAPATTATEQKPKPKSE